MSSPAWRLACGVGIFALAGCLELGDTGASGAAPVAPSSGSGPEVLLTGEGCEYWTLVSREDADVVADMLPPGVKHRYGVGPVGVGFLYFVACERLALGGAGGTPGAIVTVATHVESPAADNGDYGLWHYTDREDVASALAALGNDVRLAAVDAERSVEAAGGGRVRLDVKGSDDWVEAEGADGPTACVGEEAHLTTMWSGGPSLWQRWDWTMLDGTCIGGPEGFVVRAKSGGDIARKAGAETHPATYAHGRTDLRATVGLVEA